MCACARARARVQDALKLMSLTWCCKNGNSVYTELQQIEDMSILSRQNHWQFCAHRIAVLSSFCRHRIAIFDIMDNFGNSVNTALVFLQNSYKCWPLIVCYVCVNKMPILCIQNCLKWPTITNMSILCIQNGRKFQICERGVQHWRTMSSLCTQKCQH